MLWPQKEKVAFLQSKNTVKSKKTNQPTHRNRVLEHGKAQTKFRAVSGKIALKPKEIHVESSEKRHGPSFMGCSFSSTHADIPSLSGNLFTRAKPPMDQSKWLLGAGSAPFQPHAQGQPSPAPARGFSQWTSCRHSSRLGDAIKGAAHKPPW